MSASGPRDGRCSFTAALKRAAILHDEETNNCTTGHKFRVERVMRMWRLQHDETLRRQVPRFSRVHVWTLSGDGGETLSICDLSLRSIAAGDLWNGDATSTCLRCRSLNTEDSLQSQHCVGIKIREEGWLHFESTDQRVPEDAGFIRGETPCLRRHSRLTAVFAWAERQCWPDSSLCSYDQQ